MTDTCNEMWNLLSPSPQFENVRASFRSYWSTLTSARQRQIYWWLREQKKHGEFIKENPLYAIQDCPPQPINWNGRQGINDMMKREKMVIAKYNGFYGTYTAGVARLFEMTDIKPLNF